MVGNKPKLLVLTTTFPRWKDDTDPPFVYELSKRLTDTFDVTVHTPHYPGAMVQEQMEGVHVHRFRYFYSRFETLAGGQGIVPKLRRNKLYCLILPFFLLSQFFSLVVLCYRIRPVIIHAHWLIPQGLLAVVIKKIFHIPVVITAHGTDVFSLRAMLLLLVKRWIVRNSDQIITVSSAVAYVLGNDVTAGDLTDIIPMGVDSAVFSPKNKNDILRKLYGIHGPFLLFVGRLSEVKGLNFLIDAMSLVIQRFPDARLLIVGQGELEGQLLDQVQRNGLDKDVLFVGGIENTKLPMYYASADLFVGPSIQARGGDREGFGLTFVEASMSGCLVMGTRGGGIEDIIVEDQTGFLVPPGETNVLAKKIVSVLERLESYSEMKTRARKSAAEKYDWAVIARQYIDLFRAYARKQ
nr:glycosyltransferase [uncultured Desulfobulbus sp.]